MVPSELIMLGKRGELAFFSENVEERRLFIPDVACDAAGDAAFDLVEAAFDLSVAALDWFVVTVLIDFVLVPLETKLAVLDNLFLSRSFNRLAI